MGWGEDTTRPHEVTPAWREAGSLAGIEGELQSYDLAQGMQASAWSWLWAWGAWKLRGEDSERWWGLWGALVWPVR